jgi:hypothetical protein
MDPRYNIPLTDPRLGRELLNDDRYHSLALNVWCRYCGEHAGASFQSLPVYEWCVDRSWPKPITSEEAVDEAEPLAYETIQHLKSGSIEKALESAERAWRTLFRGSSDFRRSRGQPAKIRFPALRAYTIRKFNPDPKQPGESTITWRRLADLMFRSDGECSRCHSKARHKYDSPCVKTLMQSVSRLKAAMKRDGIPA